MTTFQDELTQPTVLQSPVMVHRRDRHIRTDRFDRSAALDLSSFPLRLQTLPTTSDDLGGAMSSALEEVRQMTGARWAVYLSHDDSGRFDAGPSINAATQQQNGELQAADGHSSSPAVQARILHQARCVGKSVSIDEPLSRCIDDHAQLVIESRTAAVKRRDELTLITVPVMHEQRSLGAISLGLLLGACRLSRLSHSSRSWRHRLRLWEQKQCMTELDAEARDCAAVAELSKQVLSSVDLHTALIQLAGELKRFLKAHQIAIGLASGRGKLVHLNVLSGVAEIDDRSTLPRAFTAAMNEAVLRGEKTVWPPASEEDRVATLAHRKLVSLLNVDGVLTCLLTTPDHSLVGAVTCVGRDLSSGGSSSRFLTTATPYLAAALQAQRGLTGGPLKRVARRVWGQSSGKLLLLVLGLGLAAATLVPLPYRIGCDAGVQPMNRRYAVAPYAGILREVLVRPGDFVRAGQTVARMDDRELRFELAGLIAQRDLATKERDVRRTAHDAAATQMAELEIEKLQLKIDLLHHRQENLEIQSAVDGVVIAGDLEDARGAPVKTGEELLEIAPLDELRLELDVAEQELPYISEGSSVEIRLDGRPHSPISSRIRRVRPQSEVRNGQNVFVAEVDVPNTEGQLRPGMHGRAKVMAGQHSLVWISFHRAWQRIVQWMPY